MTRDQLCIIKRYYERTPSCELPQWVHGLAHYYSGRPNQYCSSMQWDYGLTQDMELLCRDRRGSLPFVVSEGLWDDLRQRRRELGSWTMPRLAKRQRLQD